MIKKVVVLGSQDLIWKAVVEELVGNGFKVAIQEGKGTRSIQHLIGEGLQVIRRNRAAIMGNIQESQALYFNHPPANWSKSDSFAIDEFRWLLKCCKSFRLQRFAFLSTIPFMKGDKVYSGMQCEYSNIVRTSGVPYYILYASRFFESILDFKRGTKLMVPSNINNSFYWVAGEDLGKLLCKAFNQEQAENREYFVQGPELIHAETVFERFARAYDKDRIRINRVSPKVAKLFALFSKDLKDSFETLSSNTYFVEEFRAQSTWKELGRPQISVEHFAQVR